MTTKKQTSKRKKTQDTSQESDAQKINSNVVESGDHVIVNPVIEDLSFSEKDDGADFVWRWEKSDLPVMEELKFPSMKRNLLENGVGELPVDYWLSMFTEENMEVLTIESYLNSQPRSTKVPVITNVERCVSLLAY